LAADVFGGLLQEQLGAQKKADQMEDSRVIFLSYAREDVELTRQLVELLGRQEWSVFWDHEILGGVAWSPALEDSLRRAGCVIVLWSQYSVNSDYVRHEASFAKIAGKLLQAVLADCNVPEPFQDENRIHLTVEDGRLIDDGQLHAFFRSVASRIGSGSPTGTLPEPRPHEAISADHLTLVHSSWRRSDKDVEFGGAQMFQIHVIVFGQPAALDRIDRVVYHLDPAYPYETHVGTSRAKNFGFYDLANGYSMIRAVVKVVNQVELVELARFINLSETGPRLSLFYDR
jgi:hypothetical protein